MTEPRVGNALSHTRIINKVRNDIVAVLHLIVSIAYFTSFDDVGDRLNRVNRTG